MTSTTLSPSFLQAALLLQSFKGKRMIAIEATLLSLAMAQPSVMATDIPPELLNGSTCLSGASVGALVSIGLLEVTARIKSPKENAKGRRLDVLSIPAGKRGAVLSFLKLHDFPLPEPTQQTFLLLTA